MALFLRCVRRCFLTQSNSHPALLPQDLGLTGGRVPPGRREETVQGTAPRAVLCLPRPSGQQRLEVELSRHLQGQHGQGTLEKTAHQGHGPLPSATSDLAPKTIITPLA